MRHKIALIIILAVVLISPASASAATNAGVKPGSFFYFFDTAFEKVRLFFVFNPEKKARKALEYADERLAEIEAVAEEKDPDAIKTAIANYENNIAFVAEKSKSVTEKEKSEALLTTIAGSTSKHQEVLADVLAKVPEEAKEAITKAIEVSHKGQEEATKQIAEIKGEIEQLKKEIEVLKQKNNQTSETEILKKEIEELKKQRVSPAPAQKKAESIKQENEAESVKTQGDNKDENFWELVLTLNAGFRETTREYKGVISENPHYLQSRLDELDTNIRIIRNTYFKNATGDLALFNEMFKLLEDSYQSERDYVQKVLDNTNKILKLFDDMISYYDSKVNYYLNNPTKFVSMETWATDGKAYYEGQSDKMHEVMSVGIQDFSNFVDNMKRKDKEYYDIVALIKESLESYSTSYSSYTPPSPTRDYNYYDNIVNDLFSKPSILNPITCNITGKDVLGNQTVTCY